MCLFVDIVLYRNKNIKIFVIETAFEYQGGVMASQIVVGVTGADITTGSSALRNDRNTLPALETAVTGRRIF